MFKRRSLSHWIKSSTGILYHVLLVVLSASMAFSLPGLASFVARKLLFYWSFIEDEMVFVVGVEIVLAILFMVFFSYLGTSWKNRRIAKIAGSAGLIDFFLPGQFLAQRRIKKLKERHGLNRDVLIISATGFRTFVDPQSDLHRILQNCREAKIMLLNPHGAGARARAKSMMDPNITPELFNEQIRKSIDFLKELKTLQKNIALKLYDEPPYLKLAILGDHIWMKHYHPGLDVHGLPEYLFQHDQNPGSLYLPFYQYFLMRWRDSNIPEYDLDTDEVIYRDMIGNELKRKNFDESELHVAPQRPRPV